MNVYEVKLYARGDNVYAQPTVSPTVEALSAATAINKALQFARRQGHKALVAHNVERLCELDR